MVALSILQGGAAFSAPAGEVLAFGSELRDVRCSWHALWRFGSIKEGHYVALEDLPGVGAGVEFTTVAQMWENVAMLAAWGEDKACRPGQRASTKLDAVSREVTTVAQARTNEPPLVPLSWVGYLALALAGAEALRVPFWCFVPYTSGGAFWRNRKVPVGGEVGAG